MPRVWSRLRWWIGLAALCSSTFAGWAYWNAHRALSESAREVASDARLRFTVSNVNAPVESGIESIAVPPSFRDVAVFQSKVFLSGATGIQVFDESGAPAARYRTGLELPAAEIGPLAVGTLPGTQGTSLLIGTNGQGLLVFDGSHFRQVLPDAPKLRRITAVLPLATGRILLGTANSGIAVWDGDSLTAFDAALDRAQITALAGEESDFWIGTLADGLWHSHGGQLEHVQQGLPDPQILSLALRGDHTFAGTPLGVFEWQPNGKERVLAGGSFARALLPSDETLWVGTEDEGIVEVDLRARPSHHVPLSAQTTTEPVVRLAEFGGTRIAVTPAAVLRDEGHRWTRAFGATPTVLTDRNIAALHLAHGSNLWVGYFDRGLDILTGRTAVSRHLEDDHLFCINRIAQPATGTGTAVATANGLVLFDAADQVRQVLGRRDGLLADHVTDIAFRPSGMVAATPAGLSFVDAGGIHSLFVFHGLVNNHVYAVATAGEAVLAGTLGGLSVLDHDLVRANYTTGNSALKHNWITALVPVGADWFVGTYGSGVLRLDKDSRWDTFPDLRDNFVVNPHALVTTRAHVVAGTLDRGLEVYTTATGRWSNYTAGLPSLSVTALQADGDGIFVGTDNGLVRIEERLLP